VSTSGGMISEVKTSQPMIQRCKRSLSAVFMAAQLSNNSPARTLWRPRKDVAAFDLISDVLHFGKLWYGEPNAISKAIDYAKFHSRSHDAVIHVYARPSTRISA
jgi:hypothetical protein